MHCSVFASAMSPLFGDEVEFLRRFEYVASRHPNQAEQPVPSAKAMADRMLLIRTCGSCCASPGAETIVRSA